MHRQNTVNQPVTSENIAAIATDINQFRAYVDSFELFFEIFVAFPDYRIQLLNHLYLIEDLSLVEHKRLINENHNRFQNDDIVMDVYSRVRALGDIYIDHIHDNILTDEDVNKHLSDDLSQHICALKVKSTRLFEHFQEAANIEVAARKVRLAHNKFQLARICYPILVEQTANFRRLIDGNSLCLGWPNPDGALCNLIDAMEPYENDILCQVVLHLSCVGSLIGQLRQSINAHPQLISKSDALYHDDTAKRNEARARYAKYHEGYQKRYAYIRCLLEIRKNAYILGQPRKDDALPELPVELLIAILLVNKDPIVKTKHAEAIACHFFGRRPTVDSAALTAAPSAADAAAAATPALKR